MKNVLFDGNGCTMEIFEWKTCGIDWIDWQYVGNVWKCVGKY